MDGFESFWRDLKFGVKNLRKDLRFTSLAVMALALGIGSATVIFSAVDGILLNPLPYKNPDRLTIFYIHDLTRPHEDGRAAFTVPEFMDFREQNSVFEDMIGYSGTDVIYTGNHGTKLFTGCWVTPNSFEFLGIKPLLGRWITAADGQPGAPPVFAMSDRLWTSDFDRDPKILGTTMVLNGKPRTLIGIMPPRFLLNADDLWMPIAWGHADFVNSETNNLPLYIVARGKRKPGVSLKASASNIDVVATHLAKVYPRDFPKRFTVLTKTLNDSVVGQFRYMFYALMAAVLMLLLIACSNVANLLLAKATVRQKEIAIRAALGATRGRIVRQLLTEGLLLSAGGCILGCVLAYFGLKGVVAAIPPGAISPVAEIDLNPLVLLFAAAIAILSTLLSGLAPAIHAVRGELNAGMIDGGRGAGSGSQHGKLRAALVVAEVAMSILLLAGAGLMMRSLFALQRVDLGIDPSNILVSRFSFPKGRYDTVESKRQFFQALLPRVTALPGVIAATETASLPPFGGGRSEVTVPGKSHADRWDSQIELCSEGYFKTLRIRLLRGRLLSDVDVDSARHVAVVNELLTKKYFTGQDPIGQTIKFNAFDQIPDAPRDTYFEIIGVVNDVKNMGVQESPEPGAFLPYTITGLGSRVILIKTASDPLAMLGNLTSQVSTIDSGIPLTLTGSLESYLNQFFYAKPKFGLITLGAFAGIGLLLVVTGIFSVMAYSVSIQTHDIGIQMALGAQQSSIMRGVLRKGLVLIIAGILVGTAASLGLTRVLASQIWGVSATDPLTFGVVICLVVSVGLAACWLPARRATQVDPLVALRYE